jgi:hypothetical protein
MSPTLKPIKYAVFCLSLLIACNSLFAQNAWIVKKEKNGIRISSRSSEFSKFNDLKIEMDLTGTVSQLAAILLDVARYTEWAYGTKTCMLIKKVSNSEVIYYSEFDVPWPATNRDLYADFKVVIDSVSKSLKVISVGMKDYQPEKKDLVRVPMSKGTWNVTTISSKIIHLEYILAVNPGGSVPAWILNMFATRGPMETFERLKEKMVLLNR